MKELTILKKEWGLLVIEPKYRYAEYFSEGLAMVEIDNSRCGYINKKGEYIIKPIFSACSNFKDGLALVITDDGKKEFINKKAEIVLKPEFAFFEDFSEELLNVQIWKIKILGK